MRKIFFLLIVCILFAPLYAGVNPEPSFEVIRSGRLLKRPHFPRKTFYTQFPKNVKRVAFAHRQTLKKGHSFPSTFQIQHTDNPLARAACGSTIGFRNGTEIVPLVTVAGHAARDISKRNRLPYIRVQTESGLIFIPIEEFFYGNPGGIDLAFAYAPEELLPYITVLQPAEHSPSVGETVTFQGFLEKDNQPFTLEDQPILFSTPFTVLIKKTNEEDMMGTCGSPGFTNGLVSMIEIGYDEMEQLTQLE